MIFYDEGTAYPPLPCSHYNGNTVLVSRAAAKAAVYVSLMPARFAVSQAFNPQNRSPDWSKLTEHQTFSSVQSPCQIPNGQTHCANQLLETGDQYFFRLFSCGFAAAMSSCGQEPQGASNKVSGSSFAKSMLYSVLVQGIRSAGNM